MAWHGEIPCHQVGRFLYVEVPKAACTSIKWALAEYAGQKPEGDIHRWLGYTEARDLEQLADWLAGRWSKLFRFTVLRDPIDRFESFYYGNKVYERVPDINEFVLHGLTEIMSNIHSIPQTALVGDASGFDFVGRVRDMDGVARRLSRVVHKRVRIEQRNMTPPGERQWLRTAALRRLNDIYAADFDILP